MQSTAEWNSWMIIIFIILEQSSLILLYYTELICFFFHSFVSDLFCAINEWGGNMEGMFKFT